jgi:hypothetical protein
MHRNKNNLIAEEGRKKMRKEGNKYTNKQMSGCFRFSRQNLET